MFSSPHGKAFASRWDSVRARCRQVPRRCWVTCSKWAPGNGVSRDTQNKYCINCATSAGRPINGINARENAYRLRLNLIPYGVMVVYAIHSGSGRTKNSQDAQCWCRLLQICAMAPKLTFLLLNGSGYPDSWLGWLFYIRTTYFWLSLLLRSLSYLTVKVINVIADITWHLSD